MKAKGFNKIDSNLLLKYGPINISKAVQVYYSEKEVKE